MQDNKTADTVSGNNTIHNKKKGSKVGIIIEETRDNNLKIIINLPNLLTILRIILAPFFMILLFKDRYVAAFVILLIASITDYLDGKIARKFNMQTQFGKILDPIADKVLIFLSVLALLVKFHFPLWIGLIIIARDVLILCGGALIIRKKKQQYLTPSILGKTSTVFQLLSILVYIVASLNDYHALWIDILLYLTVVITVLSGLSYALSGYLILKSSSDNSSNDEIVPVTKVGIIKKVEKKIKHNAKKKHGSSTHKKK